MLYNINYSALLLGCLMNNTQLLFNPTPILAKKYRPKRKFKFDLTFD